MPQDSMIELVPVLVAGEEVFVPLHEAAGYQLAADLIALFSEPKRAIRVVAGIGALVLGGVALHDLLAPPAPKKRRPARRRGKR